MGPLSKRPIALTARGKEQEACSFDELPVVLQLDIISQAKALHAVGVSSGWLGLMLQSGVRLKLDFSLQRSHAAQAFWREQLSAPGVHLRLLLSDAANAPATGMGWLFHAASYPGITHLVSYTSRMAPATRILCKCIFPLGFL